MQLDLQVNKTDYKISKTTNYDGTISIVLTPKKRNCKACGKHFQSNGNEVIYWKGKNNEDLFGYFCKKHFVEAKVLLKDLRK